MEELRVLIDYATGDNWQMPESLYHRYQKEACSVLKLEGRTVIECWLNSLEESDKKFVTKK